MPVTEWVSLSYFDKIRIEHAITQTRDGFLPVSVHVEVAGQKYRVLVSKETDKAKVLAERQARS